MGHDWVIHVLSDLRQFAQQNELPLLSEQLDEAMTTAAVEIAARGEKRHRQSKPQPGAAGDPLND
jgi:predicted transcriptional regulator